MYIHHDSIQKLLTQLRVAWHTYVRPLSISALARESWVLERARVLVAYYYYLLPFAALLFASNTISNRENFEPFGPIFFIQYVDISYPTLVLLLKLAFVLISLVGIFAYKVRLMRAVMFLTLLFVHALESSFGTVNHQWYLWVYTSLIFVFLPNIWRGESSYERNRVFLLVIWCAQAAVMLAYTMAGVWKFYFDYYQYIAGSIHGLAVNAFAYQVANWVPRLQSEALLAEYVIQYPYISWPFYVGLQFLQLFAFWTVLRPSLQVVWLPLLILFHIGTLFTMGISFHPMILVVLILFVHSPFIPKNITFSRIMSDLPIIGHLYERIRTRA